jgi:tripartite-type tricarboxylate transporter receptor subunit TctC
MVPHHISERKIMHRGGFMYNRGIKARSKSRLVAAATAGVAVLLSGCGADSETGETTASAAGGTDCGFYNDKTVRLVVGYAPGGLYDTLARRVSEYLPEAIGGNTEVVVENLEGAGSLLAANQAYSSPRQDGTEIVLFDEGLVLQDAVGDPNVTFDAEKFQWLGSMQSSPTALIVRSSLNLENYSDLADYIESGNDFTVGTTAPGTTNYGGSAALVEALDLPMQVVTGYGGAPEIALAMKSGEVDALFLTVGSRQMAPHFADGSIEVLLHHDPEDRDLSAYPELDNSEMIPDIISGDPLEMLNAVITPQQLSRPMAMGPDVPAERVACMEEAIGDVLADPRFEADIKQAEIPFFEPKDGDGVREAIDTIFSVPGPMKDEIREFLIPQG